MHSLRATPTGPRQLWPGMLSLILSLVVANAPLRDLTAALGGDYSPAFVDRLLIKSFDASASSKLTASIVPENAKVDELSRHRRQLWFLAL